MKTEKAAAKKLPEDNPYLKMEVMASEHRLEKQISDLERRVDQRFNVLELKMEQRFGEARVENEKRFGSIDKRFAHLDTKLNIIMTMGTALCTAAIASLVKQFFF